MYPELTADLIGQASQMGSSDSFDYMKILYIFSAFICLIGVFSSFVPSSRAMFTDHVHFVHATLGAGKTSLVVAFALQEMKRNDRLVYSTFFLEGAKPLNLREKTWPNERGALIIIDELLLLDSNNLIPLQWFSRGATLCRQLGQQLVIISQDSRLPNRLRPFRGTIGLYLTMTGFKWFGGRLIILKRSCEPFVRRSKGFKAAGQKTAYIYLNQNVFKAYNSRMIYGYTVDNQLNWLTEDDLANWQQQEENNKKSKQQQKKLPKWFRRAQ